MNSHISELENRIGRKMKKWEINCEMDYQEFVSKHKDVLKVSFGSLIYKIGYKAAVKKYSKIKLT